MSPDINYDVIRETPSKFVSTVLDVSPFEYQKGLLDSDARHRVIASGRQVGKSRMCAWLALHKAMTESHTQVLITAPSLRQSSLLFKTLYSEIEQSGIPDEQWGIERDTQTIIEFDNGSSIHCLPTGRNGNKIRGFTADMVLVDEAAFIEDSIFEDILQPMLFATSGQMVLASTPWGRSGFFYDKFDSATHDDRWEKIQVSSYDNPIIDEADLEEFKEGKTRAQIKREVLGKFVDDSGQFFPTQAIGNCMPGGKPERRASDSYLGADIAGTGEDRTVFYGVDESGNVWLNDEVYEDMGVLEAASRIETLDEMYDFDHIYVDRTAIGEGTVEALAEDPYINRKLTQVYFSVQKKQQIYQRLKAALEAGYLHLPHDKTLRAELESIGEDKTSAGNLRLYPRGNADASRDDHVDALALACWGLSDFGDQSMHRDGSRTVVSAQRQHPRDRQTVERDRTRRPSVSSQNTRGRNRRRRR